MLKQRKSHKDKWREATEKSKTIKNYSSNDSFYAGDVLSHTKYGLGHVETSFGNKIEVRFEDKIRLLIHKLMF